MAKNNLVSVLTQTLKLSLPFLLFFLMIGVIWYGIQAVENPNLLPIKTVTISADAKNIPADTLKNLVADNVHGGLLSLNARELSSVLMSLPWVKTVAIQRVWPNKIKVIIKERRAEALWGKTGAIDQDGDLFFPEEATLPKNLPVLAGPDDHAADLVSLYKLFNTVLTPLSMTVTNLTLSDRGSWQLELSNGLAVILGGQDMEQRFQRFVSLYPKIIGDNSSKALTVDLRYPNGVAVQWKSGKPKP